MKNTIFVLVVLLPVLTCQARTITVDDDLPADFNNIQAAIDDANDGDVVEVQPGRYTGPGNRDIDFKGKAITVRSIDPNDPNIVAGTIIDCNGIGRGFYFHNEEDANSVLSGLTITNGRADRGGAIYIYRNCNPIIKRCVIKGNSTTLRGGGITCLESKPLIIACTIADNTTDFFGGGLYGEVASPVIRNCTITGNSANTGGGLYVDESYGDITGCTITNNSASRGGGVYGHYGNISNCIISNNFASEGGGLRTCRGVISSCIISGNSGKQAGAVFSVKALINCTIVGNSTTVKYGVISGCKGPIVNCIIRDNRSADTIHRSSAAPLYSCLQVNSSGKGSFTSDPCFVDPGYWDQNSTPQDANDDFWVDGDYHLRDQSACIDAGNYAYCMNLPSSDHDGGTRFTGRQVDIGCYEFGSTTDIDGDWLPDACEPAYANHPDRDNDGIVDGLEILQGSDPNTIDPLRQWNIPEDANSIQEALFFSRSGETIVVSKGTYYENIFLGGRSIQLMGENPYDANVVASTIINADTDHNALTANGYAVTFLGYEGPTAKISGLTITGGNGGIYGAYGRATIENCIITRNLGSGVTFWRGTIRNCIISENSGGSGGGVDYCTGPIIGCTIKGNSAKYAGGGLSGCYSVRNCLIEGNRTQGFGGAIWLVGYNTGIVNCTLTGNYAEYGGGAIATIFLSQPFEIRNSILWNNAAPFGSQIDLTNSAGIRVSFSNIQGQLEQIHTDSPATLEWGAGSINADPCFANPGYWAHEGDPNIIVEPNDPNAIWIDGDYHLKSQAGRWDQNSGSWIQDDVTSPCIDAGNPGCPLEDEPNDVNNVRINMGAYGGTAQASKTPIGWGLLADLDNDWIVNFLDYAVFLQWALPADEQPWDLNRDGQRDLRDLRLLTDDWLKQRNLDAGL